MFLYPSFVCTSWLHNVQMHTSVHCVPSCGIKCTTRGLFSLHIPSHLFKVFVHLPFTLFCACCFTHSTKKLLCCLLVMLRCLTQFFASLSPFYSFASFFVHAKNGLVLKRPYFSVPFFFWLFYFFSPVIKSHTLHTLIFILIDSSILLLGSSKSTSLPSQLWTPPVEAC